MQLNKKKKLRTKNWIFLKKWQFKIVAIYKFQQSTVNVILLLLNFNSYGKVFDTKNERINFVLLQNCGKIF